MHHSRIAARPRQASGVLTLARTHCSSPPAQPLTLSPAYPLTHSHSPTHSVGHLGFLTYALATSLTHLPAHPFIRSPPLNRTHAPTFPLSNALAQELTCLLIDPLQHARPHVLIHLPNDSVAYSRTNALGCPLAHSRNCALNYLQPQHLLSGPHSLTIAPRHSLSYLLTYSRTRSLASWLTH